MLDERVRMPEGFICAAKLTDFGGASLAGEDVLTHTGDVLGTLAYMAPEQSEGREVGEEADLYALALVLYEALSGVNPVRGATPAATARRIGERLTPLERRRRDLPRALTRALDAALVPCPARSGHPRASARGPGRSARGGPAAVAPEDPAAPAEGRRGDPGAAGPGAGTAREPRTEGRSRIRPRACRSAARAPSQGSPRRPGPPRRPRAASPCRARSGWRAPWP